AYCQHQSHHPPNPLIRQVYYYLYFWIAISNLGKNEVRSGLDKNLHRFRPRTQGQINDLGFPEPESSDLSARASPPKFLIPTLRKPRRVGQPQLGGAKGGPARHRSKADSKIRWLASVVNSRRRW